MKNHIVTRSCSGHLYRCKDIGCDNFDTAEKSRIKIKEKQFISGFLEIEAALSGLKAGDALPSWIPKDLRVYHSSLNTTNYKWDLTGTPTAWYNKDVRPEHARQKLLETENDYS